MKHILQHSQQFECHPWTQEHERPANCLKLLNASMRCNVAAGKAAIDLKAILTNSEKAALYKPPFAVLEWTRNETIHEQAKPFMLMTRNLTQKKPELACWLQGA